MSKFWCCQIFVFTSLVNVGFMASGRLDRNIRLGFLVHLSPRVGQSKVFCSGECSIYHCLLIWKDLI